MLLDLLIQDVDCEVINKKQVDIKDLCVDSRKCLPDTMFFCIPGGKVDAHNFAQSAVKKGAVALVVNRKLDINVVQILVKDVRKALSLICSNFYNNVDKKLNLIGITGTNGKTTTSFIVKSILENCGKKVGLIGTSGCFIGDEKIETHLTTPDTLDLFRLFDNMLQAKVEYVVMEVSAHAIALNKIYGVKFDIGVFTNLTQDHLDFFGNMQNYWQAKKTFLTDYCNKVIVNVDDPYGRELLDEDMLLFTYGLENPSDLFAININMSILGSEFYVNLDDAIEKVHFKLPGKYNVYNVMAGIYVANLCGINFKDIVSAVDKIESVDGRFDVKKVKDFFVIIDYAHSPDALDNVLSTARALAKAKVITVFGSSGYRDSLKRPIMGEVVSKYSDYSIITSDNPRYERPLDIIQSIARGFTNNNYKMEPDRVKAVSIALNLARKDDIVVICGKGHEKGQNIMGVDVPYCDYDEVQKFIDMSQTTNIK